VWGCPSNQGDAAAISPAPNIQTASDSFGASLPHNVMHSAPSGLDSERSNSAAVASRTGLSRRKGEHLADRDACLLRQCVETDVAPRRVRHVIKMAS